MTRVVIHIDRLVLTGLRERDASRVGEALRGELARRFDRAAALALATRGDRSRMVLQIPRLASSSDATRVGTLVGSCLARGMTS